MNNILKSTSVQKKYSNPECESEDNNTAKDHRKTRDTKTLINERKMGIVSQCCKILNQFIISPTTHRVASPLANNLFSMMKLMKYMHKLLNVLEQLHK